MNPEKWIFYSFLASIFLGSNTSIDIITSNQSIKDGDLLISNGETFALGFLSPGNSIHRYVGIWYNKVSEQTVVWVANREKPITGTSGVLSINQQGNLVIYVQNQSVPLWQTNVSAVTAKKSYAAQLLDSGNLVLLQDDSVSRIVIWQSFDYPTHTQLPNMKLGLDRRTGLNRFLTSWKSRDDPSAGEYSYRVDPSGWPRLVLYKGSGIIWRSVPAIGNKWIGSREMTTFIFDGSYVHNRDEVSNVYTLINTSIVSNLFLNEFGSIQMVIWLDRWVAFYSLPKDRCDNYGWCGVYGYCDSNNGQDFECTCLPGYKPKSAAEWYLRDAAGGCEKKHVELAMCGNGEGFVTVVHAKIPDTSKALVGMNLGMQECEEKCLKNCSCTAYSYNNGSGGNCFTWYGNLMDVRKYPNGGLDLYIRVDAVELAQYKKSKTLHGKKVTIVVTSVVISVLITSLVCWLVWKKTRKGLDIKGSIEENLDLPIFGMATIAGATQNFSDTNQIGEGGFGPVYKGQLPTGKDIAVKRLSTNSKQGLEEFKNEVLLIAKLQHRNLVRLLGCCIHEEERMLVYEYMPNGSLDSFIFSPENKRHKLLSWRMRSDIIVGIARGVLYLHHDSRLRVIHRDLKASNVLLDNEMNPKISDFGLARAFGGDQSSAKTRRVIGTYGYMSPEYAIDGLISMKSDVFSFGVIVLEIMSGKRNRTFHHPDHDLNLLGHAWNLWIEGKTSELIDPLIEGSFSMSKALRCIHVGLLCVQKCPEDRPTMSSVFLMLISESVMLPQPKQPGFYTERSSNEKCISSTNNVTITHLEAR